MGMTHYIRQIVWAQSYPWYVVEVMKDSVVVTDCSEDHDDKNQVWTTEFMFDELENCIRTRGEQDLISILKSSLRLATKDKLSYGPDLISDLIK